MSSTGTTAASLVIGLDLQQAAVLAKGWQLEPAITERELTAAIWEGELLAQREIVERTPRGIGSGGGLAGSIQAREPEIGGHLIVGLVGTPLVYAEPVEFGTRPHMPPAQPIRDWVRHVLGLGGAEGEAATEAIRWKIFRHGTQGAHMFEGGFEAVRGQIIDRFNLAVERIAAALAGAGR